jgi:hypothetical protein
MIIITNTIFWKDGSKTSLKLNKEDTTVLNKTFVEMTAKMINVTHQVDTPILVHIKMSEIKMIWEGGKPFWQVN